MMMGKHQDALVDFDRAIVLQPGRAAAHFNWGVALHELGQLDEALAAYGGAVTLQAGYAGAHYHRGLLLQELKRPAPML